MADPTTTAHDHPFSVWLEPGETKERGKDVRSGGRRADLCTLFRTEGFVGEVRRRSCRGGSRCGGRSCA